jgi:hypothetical protein
MLGQWGSPVECRSICPLYCKLIGCSSGRWSDDRHG